MRLSHLGIPVTDLARSRAFYENTLGYQTLDARQYPDGTLILRDGDGFDLALHPVGKIGTLPEFLHFGFRLDSPQAVHDKEAALRLADVPITDADDEDGYVAFKCIDPDGHRVEIYWEPHASDPDM